MEDTRLAQALALIDDARTLLADIAEEIPPCDPLEAARVSLNCGIEHLQILGRF